MARAAFPGFPEETLTFFRRLERNNKREWFQPRKELFDAIAKGPMLELLAALNTDLNRHAPMHVHRAREGPLPNLSRRPL